MVFLAQLTCSLKLLLRGRRGRPSREWTTTGRVLPCRRGKAEAVSDTWMESGGKSVTLPCKISPHRIFTGVFFKISCFQVDNKRPRSHRTNIKLPQLFHFLYGNGKQSLCSIIFNWNWRHWEKNSQLFFIFHPNYRTMINGIIKEGKKNSIKAGIFME